MTRDACRQRGFTYIGLLLAIALMTVGLGAAVQIQHTIVQRANEAQLDFVGAQFKQALERYYGNTPGGVRRFPQTLDELLRDPRHPVTVRYLRKIYSDPMTGHAQWGLVKQDDRIVGVYSLSEKTPLRRQWATADAAQHAKYSDWTFIAEVPPSSVAPVARTTTAAPVAVPRQITMATEGIETTAHDTASTLEPTPERARPFER